MHSVVEIEGHAATPRDLHRLAVQNYGHFTSMQVRQGRVPGFGLHLERLVTSSRVLFGHPVEPERVRFLLRHALDGKQAASARINVFSRDGDAGDPAPRIPSVMVSISEPAAAHPERPWRVHSTTYQRDLPTHKHVATMGLLHQRRAARARGFDDVLFCADDSSVIEGSIWNIALWDEHQVIFPDGPALPGITMQLLRNGLTNIGVVHTTKRVTLPELAEMRSAVATNSLSHRQPIGSIDDVTFNEDPILRRALDDAWKTVPAEPV